MSLRKYIEQGIGWLEPDIRNRVEELAKSSERVITARDLLLHENSELTRQNDANSTRASRKWIIVGKGKIMSYEDIKEAIRKREEEETLKRSHLAPDANNPGPTPRGKAVIMRRGDSIGARGMASEQ
ncbi:hypothetical protein AYL99_11254 [Fonsecaea erecta]|uniref:Uncharacterized protein n=1 Tax=Fonsecaea erecta TaxID=1367422 RepID=A0A178Z5R7_9EURO|nr:hypothetical protein AYL99_11254 [Fonsecaea erecta]OAP54806.1 hypothetical protein AYL99_11254 [Fonsecaea erecta]